MIDVKPPEEERENPWQEFFRRINDATTEGKIMVPITDDDITDVGISKELHELNKTLKEILREMRKRKV